MSTEYGYGESLPAEADAPPIGIESESELPPDGEDTSVFARDAAAPAAPWVCKRGALLLDGKYALVHPIGEGGMGTVWRATHVKLDRSVAVKFVKAEGERAVEHFLREALLAASIRNPYVIDMLDFGTTPTGAPFLVMELLEGEGLDARMLGEALSAAEAVRLMCQVLAALDAVHKVGIVHCDMKPSNVFLSNDGSGETFARLIDFGISYSLDPKSTLRRGQYGTDTHLICGTPEYISPEQAEGRDDVDARADVYATGVMLYEILSGALPFEGQLPGVILSKVIVGAHVPLGERCPDILELADVVERAMAHDRDARPQTASELRQLLLAVMGHDVERSLLRRTTPGSYAATSASPSDVETQSFELPGRRTRLFRALRLTGAVAIVAAAAAAALGARSAEPRPAIASPPPTSSTIVASHPPNVASVLLPLPTPDPASDAPPTGTAPPPGTDAPPPAPAVAAHRAHDHEARDRAAPVLPDAAPEPPPEAPATGALHRELDF